jgi:hypothetical protein
MVRKDFWFIEPQRDLEFLWKPFFLDRCPLRGAYHKGMRKRGILRLKWEKVNAQ